MGQNDGGIKRGDRAETGDNEARPTDESGNHPGHSTGDPSALAESKGENTDFGDVEALDESGGEGTIDDLTIHRADDPNLGLTGTPDHPAEDWAADTGPTRVP